MEKQTGGFAGHLLFVSRPLFLAASLALAFSGCQPGGEVAQPPATLGEKIQDTIREAVGVLKNPVALHLFEGGKGETAGRETRALVEFMAETSPMITLSISSFEDSPAGGDLPSSLGVSHGPVITIEGLADGEDLHPLQEEFVEHEALQCGFCTPGMIMNAYGMLLKNGSPSETDIKEGMEENLCRCGAHQRIVAAIETAAEKMRRPR